ncbi:transcription-repair coupling factor [Acidipropionibacterium acidipropionici]|uniref:Transcription-repair-coupling factor n=1 Tax=Acidipropionibacterium acidipropionici TaxID=1748 RepID=A0AAC9AP88_9ACTN|nr:transcription-repair coupling factor [Acidipropionibacterium acidipropionici]AMS06568.1 transcription-repair coupling factor [Acidipropionibacterium acidipropionici]AOZ48010.1 transcription-repair coupling factor [Acidipropionibacterium acidipropionici]AZP38638.1 transcription-repair coupling factor [Acidipropionibacterium acidipropionici]QCV95583.1 transcription-repair coupling factor [Acidipropionibacterium acidipropionici]
MSLGGLVSLLSREPVLTRAIRDSLTGHVPTLDLGAAQPSRPAVTAAIARGLEGSGRGLPILLITSTFREAEEVTAHLESWLGDDEVCYYPSWETLPHERLSPRSDTVGRRLSVLRRIMGTDGLTPPSVVVAPIRAALQPQVADLGAISPVRIAVGQEYDLTELATELVAAAYVRVDMVTRRGEFAVRGGILDVFPPVLDHPVRIDFFGDEVEEIRTFTVADQRSTDDTHDDVVAAPCRELILTPEVRARARALLPDHPELADMLEKIGQGQAVEGMEALIPALVDRIELLSDVLPANSLVILTDPELIRSRAAELVATSEEFLHAGWAAAAGGGQAPIDLAASGYRTLAEVRTRCLDRGMSWWSMSSFSLDAPVGPSQATDEDLGTAPDTLNLHLDAVEPWHGDLESAVASMRTRLEEGWTVILTVEGEGLGRRMVEVLSDHGVSARLEDDVDADTTDPVVHIVRAHQRQGFSSDRLKLVVHGSADLTGEAPGADRATKKMPARRRNQIQPLELKAGDLVVHEQHGVGRYVEMIQRTVAGATREYLVIEYAPARRGQPGDRLFVPMDSLDEVTRYVGGDAPALDKMGGADWKKRKARARKAVKQIAAGLIKLYAARQATKGHAFGPDTTWQHELEDAFAYVETPDQLTTIADVKRDMEQVVPMDRLVCGDVGYGKTEIAVRAAFKAVQDGKQVAVLVPTTLLVQQHTQTFSERYAGFPVNVASLSRFQTDAEARKVKEGIQRGTIDVVVGTHRLLSDQIHFKDLGLVIIDEEQRFGVEHKEALKKLRVNVDVLSMSATPIPRTLEMAVTGIREMSTIATPPEERHPVLTFAGPYDQGQVVAAIRRELAREGQVFFIHNRVQDIEKTAARIREMVPEASVVTAHGQMHEKQLEQIMVDFWERRADVLVCTTIVESGLDISTANTLIVDRADRMGLSQLHQLRGRVGRGRERGYAYFLYPADKPLTETAHDRLATMAQHTDLGAGMSIAMKDLEIRGAGNMLGGEQSGHIADVGFDLYIRLVGDAVASFRGEDAEEEPEMRIELPVDANLPTEYVESERLRLEMYRRLAEVRSDEDVDAIREELLDRYGALPETVEALLGVARFRLLCRSRGIREVVPAGNSIRFSPVHLPESRVMRLKRLYPGSVVKDNAGLVLVPKPRTARIGGRPLSGAELLEWARGVVADVLTVAPPAHKAEPTPARA